MTSLLDAIRPAPSFEANGRRRPWITPARLTGLANLCGSALISYGIGMIFVPAGVIAAGVLALALGKAAAMSTRP
jgi:hypothetical protein